MIKLVDHYHPERHYMRGPGPKWREANARTDVAKGDPGASLRKWMLTRLVPSRSVNPRQADGDRMKAHAVMDAELTKHLKIILVSVIAAIAVVAAISAQL
jgi:hypothetical protein